LKNLKKKKTKTWNVFKVERFLSQNGTFSPYRPITQFIRHSGSYIKCHIFPMRKTEEKRQFSDVCIDLFWPETQNIYCSSLPGSYICPHWESGSLSLTSVMYMCNWTPRASENSLQMALAMTLLTLSFNVPVFNYQR